MGVKLGEAFVEVYARLDRLEAGLGQAETKTKGWAGRLGGFVSNALSFTVGGLIQQGVNGITNAMNGLVQGMVGGNAEFEQYQMRFEVLLKSADAAKARLAELADFGAKTPFDLPEVVRADTILQGFGLHSEEAAKRFGYSGAQIRTIAGDVASGSGASFEQIAGYLGKFSAGATGEAIMRFQELGIVTRKQLADMGVQFDKAGALTSPVDKAMNTLLKIMSQKYDGMMAKQSKTFTGMLSNMRDWAGKALRLMGQPIFEKLRGGMESLLSFLDSPAVEGAINTFANWIANGIDGAIKSVDSLVKALTNSPIAKTITGMVSDIKEEGLGGAIKKWIGNAIDTVKDPAKRQAWIDSIGATLKAVSEQAIAWYQNNVQPLVTALGQQVQDWIQAALDWVLDNGGQLSFDLGTLIAKAATMKPEDNPFTALQTQIADWLRDAFVGIANDGRVANAIRLLFTQINLMIASAALGMITALKDKTGVDLGSALIGRYVNDLQAAADKLRLDLSGKAGSGPVTSRSREDLGALVESWNSATTATKKYGLEASDDKPKRAVDMSKDALLALTDSWYSARDAVRAYVAEINRIPAGPPSPPKPPAKPPNGNVPNSGAMPNRAPVSIVINAAGFAPAAVTRAALTAVDLLRARGAI